ncbi:DUF1642 domain-containing protein [Streptococcus uberis]|uniref:DUF1642 domain-containing protein n=1 Tax=Streptococcus uberis TaxID=1349 RepID=UPI0020C062D1|nr:DUF1642 domain-containing protein [Streptococcus uberis]
MKIEEIKTGDEVWIKGIVSDVSYNIHGEKMFDVRTTSFETPSGFIHKDYVKTVIDQPKLEVPMCIYELIKYHKEHKSSLFEAMLDNDNKKVNEWFGENERKRQDQFAQAWLTYPNITVKKEKLYTVEIPNPHAKGHNKIYLCKDGNTGKVYLCKGNFNPKKNRNLKLTESEIRKDFDWAWQQGFAKEVTE